MSWRIVYIETGEILSLYLDNLKITKDEEEIFIPLSDINSIIVDNEKSVVTGRLINKIAEYKINLVFCNDKHNPNAYMLGLNSHYKNGRILKMQTILLTNLTFF